MGRIQQRSLLCLQLSGNVAELIFAGEQLPTRRICFRVQQKPISSSSQGGGDATFQLWASVRSGRTYRLGGW
jgi:hypothetical protein